MSSLCCPRSMMDGCFAWIFSLYMLLSSRTILTVYLFIWRRYPLFDPSYIYSSLELSLCGTRVDRGTSSYLILVLLVFVTWTFLVFTFVSVPESVSELVGDLFGRPTLEVDMTGVYDTLTFIHVNKEHQIRGHSEQFLSTRKNEPYRIGLSTRLGSLPDTRLIVLVHIADRLLRLVHFLYGSSQCTTADLVNLSCRPIRTNCISQNRLEGEN